MISARLALRALVLALVTMVALAGSTSVESADVLLICIDPGHGGSEPGAVNDFGNEDPSDDLIERVINLDISEELQRRWDGDGVSDPYPAIDVVLTRGAGETRSIRERYTLCNEAGADLLLSIHTNSLADPERDGIITIYFHNDDRVLAEALHSVLLPAMSQDTPHFFQDFGVKRDALGMVLKSNMPAAVIEPVMMSNPWEAQGLTPTIADCSDPASSNCRRAEIADAIFDGTMAYIGALGSGGGDGGTGGGGGDLEAFCAERPQHRRCQ